MGVWRPGWATSPAANEVGFPADRALPVGCAQFGVATVGRGRVLWTIDDVFFVVGSNARGSRSQPCPGTTVTLLRSVPAVGLRPVPAVGPCRRAQAAACRRAHARTCCRAQAHTCRRAHARTCRRAQARTCCQAQVRTCCRPTVHVAGRARHDRRPAARLSSLGHLRQILAPAAAAEDSLGEAAAAEAGRAAPVAEAAVGEAAVAAGQTAGRHDRRTSELRAAPAGIGSATLRREDRGYRQAAGDRPASSAPLTSTPRTAKFARIANRSRRAPSSGLSANDRMPAGVPQPII